MEVSFLSEPLAEAAFPFLVIGILVIADEFLEAQHSGLVNLLEVTFTCAKSAFFCRALHIVHCQVTHLIELDQRWPREAHAGRTKADLALFADTDSTFVIKITILFAVVALILNSC